MSREEWIYGAAADDNSDPVTPDTTKQGRSVESGTTRDGGVDTPPPTKEIGRGV